MRGEPGRTADHETGVIAAGAAPSTLYDTSVTTAVAGSRGAGRRPRRARRACPPHSLGLASAQLATVVVNRVAVATCPECGRVFQVEHGRQRFHDKQCAARARYRRHAEKKRRKENNNGK